MLIQQMRLLHQRQLTRYMYRAVLKDYKKSWPIAGILLKLFDKYANDKLKRSKLIESSSKVADYKEIMAQEK